jgi:DNA-directed RNA polymerase I, II, and III subunit RPABC2
LNDKKENNRDDSNLEFEHEKDKNVKDIQVESKTKSKTTKTKSRFKRSKKTQSLEDDFDDSEKFKQKNEDINGEQDLVSTRLEKFVEYEEPDFQLKEVVSKAEEIVIGPRRLTRFEKARITGARALQLSFGAPLMIILDDDFNRNSISLALKELEAKALPISIRRILPNGLYQDIPLDWMKS